MRLFSSSQTTYKTQAAATRKLEKTLTQWNVELNLDDINWLIGTNPEGRFFAVVQISSCRNERMIPTIGYFVDSGIRVMN